MKEKVLITGGAGFIGSHTADALAKLGFRIRILDNLEPVVHRGNPAHRSHGAGGWPKYILSKGYELVRGDVRKKKDWEKALRGVSYVFHLAAYQDQRPDYSKFFETNTAGAALLYEVLAEKKLPVKKVIISSSQFVYGDGEYFCTHSKKIFYPELRPLAALKAKKFNILCPHGKPAKFLPFNEGQRVNPTNAYGLSKYAMEGLALRFGKTHGVPTTILRYSIVQGARQSPHNLYSGALRIFVTQALRGKPITVFEDGEQLRDFVNIKDVVRANVLALKNKKTDFEIINIGGGRAWSVIDFAKLVIKITSSNSVIAVGGFRRTDTRNAVSDITKLKKFGLSPRISPSESIREYVDWYRENF